MMLDQRNVICTSAAHFCLIELSREDVSLILSNAMQPGNLHSFTRVNDHDQESLWAGAMESGHLQHVSSDWMIATKNVSLCGSVSAEFLQHIFIVLNDGCKKCHWSGFRSSKDSQRILLWLNDHDQKRFLPEARQSWHLQHIFIFHHTDWSRRKWFYLEQYSLEIRNMFSSDWMTGPSLLLRMMSKSHKRWV